MVEEVLNFSRQAAFRLPRCQGESVSQVPAVFDESIVLLSLFNCISSAANTTGFDIPAATMIESTKENALHCTNVPIIMHSAMLEERLNK
jgi:hypothetical protein